MRKQTNKRIIPPRQRRVKQADLDQSHWQLFVKEQLWHVGAIGYALRHLRLQHRLHQKDLGKRVGVCQSVISRIESGLMVPYPELAHKLSEVLECAPSLFQPKGPAS